MAGALPVFREGPVTFQVNDADTVVGGTLVEADGGGPPGKIRTAGAGSAEVIGVATNDAVGVSVSQVPTVPGTTSPSINAALLPPYVAVASEGVWILTYAAAADFGDRLKTAAGGQVTPWVSGTDSPELIVGICYEPGGVGVAGTGQTRLVGLG